MIKPLLVMLIAAVCTAAQAENIVFPADAGVTDVTQPPYNAKGDGRTDCTDAFQQALNDMSRGKAGPLLYVPNGTYVISDTIRWAGRQTRHVMQGQSTAGTVIRLMDRAPGFTNPAQPQEMVWTGEFPPQRFRNAIRNVTFDTGTGNHGAIGARFNASNQGQITDVLIRSGDGSGVIGLDLGYTGDVGPLLVRNVRVIGFDVGMVTAHATAGQAMENVTLENQRVAGWVNDGQAVAIRNLRSRQTTAPALINKPGSSMVTLVGAELSSAGEGSGAIVNSAGLYARDVKTSGYALAIDASTGPGEDAPGGAVAEYTSHPPTSLFPSPARALHLPIEETPQVPWDDLKDWVNVTKYTPVEITVEKDKKSVKVMDWTDAIQQAIDSGAGTVYFPRRGGTGKPYEMHGTVHIRGNVRRIIGLENSFAAGSRGTWVLEDGTAPEVVIERFDWIYCPHTIRTNTQRTLVIDAIPGPFIDIGENGRAFIDDTVNHFAMRKGSRVWMRQFNTEYTNERRVPGYEGPTDFGHNPGNINDGGTLWVLGIKTEGDGTLITTQGGGKTEVLGGLIYANKNYYPEKKAFVVKDDSALTLSVGEWILRQQPFNMVAETRDGETRVAKVGSFPARGGGAMVVLFNAYAGEGDGAQAQIIGQEKQPVAPAAAGSGTGLRGQYFEGTRFEQLKATRVDPAIEFDWSKSTGVEGMPDTGYSVRWMGQIEPRVSGVHTFHLDPAGTRLMVGEQVVIDAWDNGARYRWGSIKLEAGKRYDIRLELNVEREKPKVSLRWAQPGQKTEVVPASQLYPVARDLPVVTLRSEADAVREGEKVAVTVAVEGGASIPVEVRFDPQVKVRTPGVRQFSARGNAVEGEDYNGVPEVVAVAPDGQGGTFTVTAPADDRPEGDRTLRLKPLFDPHYVVAGADVTLTIQDDDMPAAGTGKGLKGEYFASKDFSQPHRVRIDPQIDFDKNDWDKKPPMEGLDPAGYSVRWTGQLQPLFSEEYKLVAPATGYGWVSVTVDGQKLIDTREGGMNRGRIRLEAGRKHDLKVEYVQDKKEGYGSFVRLLWSSPSQSEQVIPATQLYAAE